ncbi:MAG: ferritin [Actinomycetota bacterium]|nr:ferritin [Actinomycetota bacterium]
MISKKMQTAINEQINAEMYSSYLYLAMSAYFENTDLTGFANWMRIQAQEELDHAMKFFDFVNERGGQVVLKDIKASATAWKSPVEVMEAVYAHEQKVTGLINDLVDLAIKEKDHASNNFLQWFVAEQVEEEASAEAIIKKLKLVSGTGNGLFMIDQELAKRVYTPPAAAE